MAIEYDYKKTINKLVSFLEDYTISITEDEILNFLKITNRWPYKSFNNNPTVEIITEWSWNCRNEFYDICGKFNFTKWKQSYDNGFTTILSDVLDLTEELRNLQNQLLKISGKSTHANFYFSKGSVNHRVSFEHHKHDYDVLVKCIYGNCKWKIGEQYFDLKPNDVIYVPSGVNHSVVECENKKLSLTINLQ